MMLERICQEHDGKLCDKWSLYLLEYERIFSETRERPVRLLEIGVQNGGSLEIWCKFFPNAERVVGCDIDPACDRLQYEDPRIGLVLADANTDEAEQQISALSSSFNVIVDDGSHRSSDIVHSFSRYFKYLDHGGMYVVEDLHCSYWRNYSAGMIHAGGLFHPNTAIGFFKLLVDIINHEHWGIDKARTELLLSFEQCCGVHFKESVLRTIHSVEFVNSLCIIKKQEADRNVLGARAISGTVEIVSTGTRGLNGQMSITPDQRHNEWSLREKAKPDEVLLAEITELNRMMIDRERRIVELEQLIEIRDADVAKGQELRAQLTFAEGELRVLKAELKAANLRLAQSELALGLAERAATGAKRQLAISEAAQMRERWEWEAQLAAAARSREQAKEEAERIRAGLEQELAMKREQLSALLSSTLWQSTYPLRVLGAKLPMPLRRTLRRSAQLVWRAGRLKLTARQPSVADPGPSRPDNPAQSGSIADPSPPRLDNPAQSASVADPSPPRLDNPVQSASVADPSPPRLDDRAQSGSVAAPQFVNQHPEIVLVSGFPGTPSEEYRVFNPLSVLQQIRRAQAITTADIGYHAETLKQASIIVLFRAPWSEQLSKIVTQARKKGSLIVYDVDDYVFEPAIAKPSIIDGMRFLNEPDLAAYHRGVQAARQAVFQADYCIVTTEFLADRLRELGKTVYVLPNSVGSSMLQRYDAALKRRRQRPPQAAERTRIGYAAGTLTHQRDFAVVRAVLLKLLRQRDDVMLTIVGHLDLTEYPDFAGFADRIEVRPPVPHDELPEEIARFDINIAPLEVGNPFCEAKSELKFFNAALVEVPTVASGTAAFRAAIRHGESGFTAINELQWLEALTTLLDDVPRRRRVGLMARSEALRQFGPGAMRASVKLVFEDLWQRRRPITLPRHAGYDHFLYAINYPAVPLRSVGASRGSRGRGQLAGAPLSLQWIVPAFRAGWGGMTNIFRIIQQLEKSGHRSTLWVHGGPRCLPNGATFSEHYRNIIAKHFPPVTAKVYPLPADLDDISGDAVIATDHLSAYPARAVTNADRRFYFLQDNEPAFSPAGYGALFAEQTYTFGFDALSNGDWLHALAQSYGMWSMKWEQAADPDHYFTPDTEKRLPTHIAFYARNETPRRAVELGYLAFELLAREGIEFHVDFFGGERTPEGLPYSYTGHGVLSAARLGEMYRRVSIGLVFSATNYSVIPREMMACGLPVLELNSESSRRSFPEGIAQLADATPESVAANLKTLLLDRARREQLARQALAFLADFSWEKSARDIEEALLFRLGRINPAIRDPERVSQLVGE